LTDDGSRYSIHRRAPLHDYRSSRRPMRDEVRNVTSLSRSEIDKYRCRSTEPRELLIRAAGAAAEAAPRTVASSHVLAACLLYVTVSLSPMQSRRPSVSASQQSHLRQLLQRCPWAVAPPGFCNSGDVRYGSIGGLEYEVPQSRLYCLCINVALCSTALQCICRVIRRRSMPMKAHTY